MKDRSELFSETEQTAIEVALSAHQHPWYRRKPEKYDRNDIRIKENDASLEALTRYLPRIPIQWRARAIAVYFKQQENDAAAAAFFREIPHMVRELQAKNLDIDAFFQLAEAALPLRSSGEIGHEQICLTDTTELELLESAGEFKQDLIDFTRLILSGEFAIKRMISFGSSEGTYHQNSIYFWPNEILRKLQKDGYSAKKIHRVFGLVHTHAWVGDRLGLLINYYAEIEKNFPGGCAALLEELEALQHANKDAYNSCMRHLIELAVTAPYSPAQWRVFLAAGRKLTATFGNAADHYYFRIKNQHLYGSDDARDWDTSEAEAVDRLLEEPETFEARLEEFSQNIAALWEGLPLNEHRSGQFVSMCLARIDDPKFPELLEGLENALARLKAVCPPETLTNNKSYRNPYEIIANFFYQLPRTNPGRHLGPLPDIDLIAAGKAIGYVVACGMPEEKFQNLLDSGFNFETASAILIYDTSETPRFAIETPDEANELPLTSERIKHIAALYFEANTICSAVTKVNTSDTAAYQAALEHLTKYADEVAAAREEITAASNGSSKLHDYFDTKIQIAFRMLAMRRVVQAGFILTKQGDLPPLPLLEQGGEVTQSIIATASFLSAVGVLPLKGINDDIQPLPAGHNLDDVLDLALRRQYETVLRANISRVAPRIERMILNHRLGMLGLQGIGAKHHAKIAIDEDLLKVIRDIFGLTSTPFHLIHANQSLVLPPVPTAYELELFIHILETLGLIQDRQLQLAGAGRMDREYASTLGSTVLLASIDCRVPEPGTFSTNSDAQTGARIMTYDGEHGEHFRIYGGPFDVQPAPGRTDQLVCYATSDAVTFQVAQNLGVQHQYQYGPLRAMYPDFSAEHRAILARHGLDGVVDSSAWVFQHANLEDTLEDHESMIRNLAEKWGQDSLQPDMGVIADMNRLVRRSMQEIVARREEIMRDYPEEVEKLRRA